MWNIIDRELKELLNTKNLVIGGMLLLLLAAAGIFGPDMGQTPAVKSGGITIGIIDLDQSMYSSMLVNYFKNDNNFGEYASVLAGNKQEIEGLFDEGRLNAYLVLPKDFAKNLIQIENVPVQVKINAEDVMAAIIIKNVLDSYEKYIEAVEVNAVSLYSIMEEGGMEPDVVGDINVKISADLVFAALGRQDLFCPAPLKDIASVPMNEYYSYVLEGVLLLYLGLYVGMRYIRERNSSVMSRITAAGVSRVWYITARIIVYTVIIGTFMLAMHSLLGQAAGLRFGLRQGMVLIAMTLFSLIMGMGLALLIHREETYMTAGSLSYILICIIGGAVIPVSYLPENLAVLSRFTPVYWMIRGMAG